MARRADLVTEPADDKARGKLPDDPTARTLEQLFREVANLKESFSFQLKAQSDVNAEKFSSVEKQLKLIEQQRVEQKADTEKAVGAALTAQKEAVREQTTASELAIGKSETAIKEQLHQLTATFATANSAQSDNLSDLKDRVGTIESERRTMERSTEKSSTNQWALAALALAAFAMLASGAIGIANLVK